MVTHALSQADGFVFALHGSGQLALASFKLLRELG